MSTTLSKPAKRQLRRKEDSGPFAAMQREFEELLERFWNPESSGGELAAISPRVDVSEDDDSVQVTTDLPGIKPEEVEVELHDNCLVIRAEHHEEKEEKSDKKFHRVERRSGSYARSVWLPSPVDESQVEAKLENGVLKVTLPKTSSAQKRRIQVSG